LALQGLLHSTNWCVGALAPRTFCFESFLPVVNYKILEVLRSAHVGHPGIAKKRAFLSILREVEARSQRASHALRRGKAQFWSEADAAAE
jgi:hypothetical protein